MLGAFFISGTRIPAIERAVTSLLILKWRLFLFPEATAIIRNEVKSMNTQIIAIANQKGGVGKTTTCANLGIGLAQAGKKVLLIDGDPQGSLTISLGNPQPDKLPFTLSDAMGKILMDQPIRTGEGILHHAEGVDLMPADIQLSGMEVSLVNAMSRETILRQYLDALKGQYSHILIDCQLPKGPLGREMYKKLFVYAGPDHKHAAQKPEVLTF